jgi:hypothetical protein
MSIQMKLASCLRARFELRWSGGRAQAIVFVACDNAAFASGRSASTDRTQSVW